MMRIVLSFALAVLGGALSAAEWISSVNQKVAGPEEMRLERAADGTSWFARKFEVAGLLQKARVEVSGLGVFELYVNKAYYYQPKNE